MGTAVGRKGAIKFSATWRPVAARAAENHHNYASVSHNLCLEQNTRLTTPIQFIPRVKKQIFWRLPFPVSRLRMIVIAWILWCKLWYWWGWSWRHWSLVSIGWFPRNSRGLWEELVGKKRAIYPKTPRDSVALQLFPQFFSWNIIATKIQIQTVVNSAVICWCTIKWNGRDKWIDWRICAVELLHLLKQIVKIKWSWNSIWQMNWLA